MHHIKSEYKQFIEDYLDAVPYHLQSLHGDASARTYHRITTADKSLILMLSPQEEATQSFLEIAQAWKQKGILVPSIYKVSSDGCGVLLSDMGDLLLLDQLDIAHVEHYYQKAMLSILELQRPDQYQYPLFSNQFVRYELDLFKDWFIQKLLQIKLTRAAEQSLEEIWHLLIEDFTRQPQTIVHRDYHSRNIMILPDNNLGIIDFQDAMYGPVTYDLISLIKDCYIKWDKPLRERWILDFYNFLNQQNKISGMNLMQFTQHLDWVGLQRHLKVMGIFSRLKLRDNKWQYIEHIPRIWEYIFEVTSTYAPLFAFHTWLENEVLPVFNQYYKAHQEAYQMIKVA